MTDVVSMSELTQAAHELLDDIRGGAIARMEQEKQVALQGIETQKTEVFSAIEQANQQKLGELEASRNATIEAIAELNNAVPAAINRMLHQKIYVDPIDGNDSNHGDAKASPKKTLKAAVDSAPSGATIAIFADPGTTLTIDEPIVASNKHIVFFVSDLSLVFNERIELYSGTLKSHYMLADIVQNTSFAIYHYSSDIYLTAQTLRPTAGNLGFCRQNYASGFLTSAGTYTANVAFQFAVSDMPATYHVFSRPSWFASMIVSLHSMTLGANVALFDPAYEYIQVGEKGVYLVGA